MGIGFRHSILFLLVISSIAIYFPHARGGCGGGPCSLGGGSSYDFLGDPAVDMDMSSPDDFVRENLGHSQTISSKKSLSLETPTNNSSSLNQSTSSNVCQNSSAVLRVINGRNTTSNNTTSDNATSDSKIVKLGASDMQDKRLSTLAFPVFNNNMF